MIQEPNKVLFYTRVGKQLLVAQRRNFYDTEDTCVSDRNVPEENSCSAYMLVRDCKRIRYICLVSSVVLYLS